MPARFISEFGLNMMMSTFILLQDEQVGQLNTLLPSGLPEFHIYIIGSRPRITIDPKKFEANTDAFSIEFVVHRGDERIRFPTRIAHPSQTRIDRLLSAWPNNTFQLLSEGQIVIEGKAAILAASIPEVRPYLDLEVLYVGQSFGVGGEREASDRLQSHSTLQKILGETSRLQPDREVWLILLHFEEIMLASFDGTMAGVPGALEADEGRIERMLSNQMSEQQKINFTEAALIRYFQPRFNEVFRKTFPNPAHKTYAECYEIDLNMVAVEICSEEMLFQLYSPSCPGRWTHFATFPLHDPKERHYMFDLLKGKPAENQP